MPHDDKTSSGHNVQPQKSKIVLESSRANAQSWFKTPESIKRLFDRFPLQTYASNEQPQRTTIDRNRSTLYVFTTEQAGQADAPSFNPSCLKWQVSKSRPNVLQSRGKITDRFVAGISEVHGC